MDILKANIAEIEKWCAEKDISIFYAGMHEVITPEVSWKRNTELDWKKYLEVARKVNTKILILEIVVNDHVNDYDEDVFEENEFSDDEEIEENKKSFEIVKEREGQIVYFQLQFIYDNVSYTYHQYADWYDDYNYLERIFSDDEEQETTQQEIHVPTTNKFSEEKIEKLAREITSSEKYRKTRSSSIRSGIVRLILKQKEENIDPENIIWIDRKADFIYETEIREELENRIEIDVLKLKAQKVKKNEIASRLGITPYTVNQFYSKEKIDK